MTAHCLAEAKSQAKALRAALAAQGAPVSHGQALELVAQQNGSRDWNTLQARLARMAPRPLRLNDPVRGHYLGQAFTGRIVALAKLRRNTQVSLQLYDPIDTVRFDSFSNMRSHIRGVVGPDGRSPCKMSNGAPQLSLVACGVNDQAS